jgi:hypothetical protein
MPSFPIPFEVGAGRFLESGLCIVEMSSVPVVSTTQIPAVPSINICLSCNISIICLVRHIRVDAIDIESPIAHRGLDFRRRHRDRAGAPKGVIAVPRESLNTTKRDRNTDHTKQSIAECPSRFRQRLHAQHHNVNQEFVHHVLAMDTTNFGEPRGRAWILAWPPCGGGGIGANGKTNASNALTAKNRRHLMNWQPILSGVGIGSPGGAARRDGSRPANREPDVRAM